MKRYKNILIVLGLILLMVLFQQIFDYRYAKKMQKTIETEAYFIENIHMKNIGPTSYYYYYVNNKKYEGYFRDTEMFFLKNDTILIKYSTEDPSISEVVDKYYMQKYKHLEKRQ